MWSIQNILLLVSGFINLAMSIFIISRGWKNKVNLYFSLLTFFNFLWALAIYLARVLIVDWFFWSLLAYPASIGIVIFLFYFSTYFPFRLYETKKIVHYIIYIPALALSYGFFIDKFIVIGYFKNNAITEYILYYNKFNYLIFAAYFFVLAIASVLLLYKKYKQAEGTFKYQLKLLLMAIVIGLAVGSFFDLIICYYGNFKYIWIGPMATLFMNMVVFYFIKSTKEIK